MATPPRQTEIDSADDLFFGGEEELEESSATEQDEVPSFDEEPPPPSDEPEPEDEAKEEASPEKKKGVPVLQYYVIPAVGAVLIMSLGWTFALIARRGLVRPPAEVAKAKKLEKADGQIAAKQDKILKPKRDLRTVRVPIQTKKEAEVKGQEGTFKANIGVPAPGKNITPPLPGAPADEAQSPGVDTGESLSVPVNHPFFIPLRGRGKKAAITFLNFSLNLLVSNKAAASEFNSKRALIREVIYLHYSRLSPDDLSTPAGRERVRRQLVAKLDKQLIQGKVRGVLFQEFYTR